MNKCSKISFWRFLLCLCIAACNMAKHTLIGADVQVSPEAREAINNDHYDVARLRLPEKELNGKHGHSDFKAANEVTSEEIMTIIPRFDFVNDDMGRPEPGSLAEIGYRKKWEAASIKYFESPTKRLAEMGSAAFPAYRKLLATFATDAFPHYKEVDFIGRAFELMPEHQEDGKNMLFEYLSSIKGREKNDQVAALNYFCKFATKLDIPRLMQLLDTQEVEVVRRILQLGDDSHVAQLENWLEQNRTTELERIKRSGALSASSLSLRYLQFVEKEITGHLARAALGSNAEIPVTLSASTGGWLSRILGGEMRYWWCGMVVLIVLLAAGGVWLRIVRRGHDADDKTD